jgi:hypothetical protein
MNTYWRTEDAHSPLWTVHAPILLLQRRDPGTHQTAGWIDNRLGLNTVVVEETSLPLLTAKPLPSNP